MDQDNQGLKNGPLRSSSFQWTFAVIDFALGVGLFYLSVFLFFRRGRDFFSTVPDEIWAILLGGFGTWVLYSGYRLVIERPPECWQAGKRRHLISAGLSGLVVAVTWLSLLDDSGHDGFGPIIGVLNFSGVFGVYILFLLIASVGMSKLASQSASDNRSDCSNDSLKS